MANKISIERSKNYYIQMRGSFLFKGLAIACTFFSVPIMIHYLGQAKFGVWSTLLSVITWITFFDLGLGNGLRNRLAESLAKNQRGEAQRFISSAYSLIGLIAVGLLLSITLASFLIPWQTVFNTQAISPTEFSYIVLATGFFIVINFWIGLINSILNAAQRTSWVIFGQFLCSTVSLILVYLLSKFCVASLFYLSMVYGISMIGSNIYLTYWFFLRNHDLVPVVSLRLSHIRPLLSLGMQFFVIQAAVLVIFTTDKILITQLFGPEFVTQYEIVFKFFSIISMVHSLITAPLWSSYTDAYHRGDFAWMRSMLRKQIAIFIIVIFSVGIMLLIAKPVIKLWIGEEINVSMPLIVSLGLFVLISVWNNIYAYFLNGIGKIKFQLYSAVIAMLINIPLAIYLTRHLGFGIDGIVYATCASLAIFALVGPVQTYVFVRRS